MTDDRAPPPPSAPPPFDFVKWSFFLVAAIIGVHAVVVLAGVTSCLVHWRDLLELGRTCDPEARLTTVLAEALAAALAFAGGKLRS